MPVKYSANLTEANDEPLRKIAAEAIASADRRAAERGSPREDGRRAGERLHRRKACRQRAQRRGDLHGHAGPHNVRVKSAGFLDSQASVVALPVATTDVALSQMPAESTQTNWKRMGGFIGLGAGAVFGSVAVISSVQVASIQGDARYTAYRGLFTENVDGRLRAREPQGHPGRLHRRREDGP